MCNREHKLELATWYFPAHLGPQLKTAMYQLIVGCEQRQTDDMLKAYAKNLRVLASSAFTEFEK